MKRLTPKINFQQKGTVSKVKTHVTIRSHSVSRKKKLFDSNLFNLVNATGPTELLLKLRKIDQIHPKFHL